MAEYTDEQKSFLDTVDEAEVTQKDIDSARKKAGELTSRDFEYDPTTGVGEGKQLEDYYEATYQRNIDAGETERKRREAGLEDDDVFDIATELHGISTGEVESADRRRTRESLEAMASGQRGLAQSGTGLRSAARLRGGEAAAQGVQAIGGAILSEESELEREATSGQLRDLMIQGRARAENKKLQMEALAFQRDQASKGMWGDILSGVLGAVGAVAGFLIAGPGGGVAGATLGGAIGGGTGKAAGRTFG